MTELNISRHNQPCAATYGSLQLYLLIDQPDKELHEDKFIAFAIKEVEYYIHDASTDIV